MRREFLEALYQVTEGNPFFIEEVLKSLLAASGIDHGATVEWDRQPIEQLAIPRTVQDAVRRRAAQLSREARQLLVLAAVAGQRFDFTLLEELTRTSGADLVQQLKEMATTQLIVEESAERFSFRHARTRQAIHSQLLGRERQRLHRTIAETVVALLEEIDDRQGLVSSLTTLAVCGGVYHTDTIVPAASLPASISLAERALGLARDIDWRSGKSYVLWNLAMCLGAQGEYGRALECAQSGYDMAAKIDHLQWMRLPASALAPCTSICSPCRRPASTLRRR